MRNSTPRPPVLWFASFFVLLVQSATACGGFFCQPQQPVLQAGENIAFGVKQNGDNKVDVTMAVQINYQGPAEAFAWILPVPAVPNLSVGSDLLFEGLFEATRPTFDFTVDNSRSTTCSEDQLIQFCSTGGGVAEDFQSVSPTTALDGGAVVLEEGTVGPFKFVTLEAAEGRPKTVFDFLETNGYDQPDEAEPLITYYAGMGMKFVALQLLKESDTGDIRPIIMDYEIEGNLKTKPVACVPIQLTKIAATPAMPIQVYMLAPNRGVPLNYMHVDLDLNFLDWVGCNRAGQNCYLNDFRNLFQVAAKNDVDGHAFVTEYAGSAEIVQDSIAFDIDLNDLYDATSALAFFNKLDEIGVPDIALVHTIVERHVPNNVLLNDNVPFVCQNQANVYTPDTPSVMNSCVDLIDFGDMKFDPVKLADELDELVFQPAQDAQDWVNSYGYLTRLYAQLDPEDMNKDPYFAFNEELEDVSRLHKAVGVPVCDAAKQGPVGLDVYVENLPEGLESPTFVDAELGCGAWFRTENGPLFGTASPAFAMTGLSFAGEESTSLLRDAATGQFSMTEVQDLIDLLDDRAPNQTVPGMTNTEPPSAAPGASSACQYFSIVFSTCSILLFIGLLE
jgi:hypothetical protein